MSPTAFSRISENNRQQFLEFLNRVRIGQACSMLYATDHPVSVICYEVGFQNLANFNRNFMKMKGMTPTSYRALARVELAEGSDGIMISMGTPPVFATEYDRADCSIGIVHVGYGAFHRAHQAVYVDDLMDRTGDLGWGIAAVNLRASEADTLPRRPVLRTGIS